MLESRHENTVVQQWDISCGAAALATLLTYGHNYPVSEREVAAAMLEHTSTDKVRRQLGFSLLDLKRFAVQRGFQADGYGELTLSDLEQFGPSIVPIEVRGGMSHFVIYRGTVGDRVFLTDPAWGSRTMMVDQFERIWEGRLGFKVADQDGLNEPNRLSPRPQDLWASSEPMPVFPRLAQIKPPEPFRVAHIEPLVAQPTRKLPVAMERVASQNVARGFYRHGVAHAATRESQSADSKLAVNETKAVAPNAGVVGDY